MACDTLGAVAKSRRSPNAKTRFAAATEEAARSQRSLRILREQLRGYLKTHPFSEAKGIDLEKIRIAADMLAAHVKGTTGPTDDTVVFLNEMWEEKQARDQRAKKPTPEGDRGAGDDGGQEGGQEGSEDGGEDGGQEVAQDDRNDETTESPAESLPDPDPTVH